MIDSMIGSPGTPPPTGSLPVSLGERVGRFHAIGISQVKVLAYRIGEGWAEEFRANPRSASLAPMR
jgi:hypothetical protein